MDEGGEVMFEETQAALEVLLIELGYAVGVAQGKAYDAENVDMLKAVARRVESAMDRAGDELSGWRDDVEGEQ